MNHFTKCLLIVALTSTFSGGAFAQKINQPKHIPNQFQNKVNHVRLQGVIERENANDNVNETRKQHLDTNKFGFNKKLNVISPSDGCSINIGNSAGTGIGSTDPKNVIIAGDVINFCK